MKRKHTAKMKGKRFISIVSGILLTLVLVFGIVLMEKKRNEEIPDVSNYEECVTAKGSSLTKTYPQQCKAKNLKTYIGPIKQPVDTKNWIVFKEIPEFSFLCPPSWTCSKFRDDSAIVYQDHYSNISNFQLNVITLANFQQSWVRNPNYTNPMSWYKAVLAKNQFALQAPASTRMYKSGTDGYADPVYVHYDFNTMEHIQIIHGEALVFPVSGDINILIPLAKNNVLVVSLSPGYLYKDPIFKEIIKSVKAN